MRSGRWKQLGAGIALDECRAADFDLAAVGSIKSIAAGAEVADAVLRILRAIIERAVGYVGDCRPALDVVTTDGTAKGAIRDRQAVGKRLEGVLKPIRGAIVGEQAVRHGDGQQLVRQADRRIASQNAVLVLNERAVGNVKRSDAATLIAYTCCVPAQAGADRGILEGEAIDGQIDA